MTLYIFEGADCTGKTSLATAFANRVGAIYYAFPGRESGTLGHHIYELHHGKYGDFQIAGESLQMLHVAAHLTVLHTRIFPWIDSGKDVVLDRFYWSTYCYGVAYGAPHNFLRALIELEQDYWGMYLDDAVLFWITRDGPLNKPYDEMDDKKALSRQNWERINGLYAQLFHKNDWDNLRRWKIVNNKPIEQLPELLTDMINLSRISLMEA